ncbi:MAG: hypothetical protein Q8R07_01650 [Candidatus Uhrbacteria bacterium]|nr:hypothetical protein [Candidatus Uhrbacteria bacterium]
MTSVVVVEEEISVVVDVDVVDERFQESDIFVTVSVDVVLVAASFEIVVVASMGAGAGEGVDSLAGGEVGSKGVDVGDSKILASFTARAIQLNETSCTAGLFKIMWKPVVVARATT